MDKKEYVATFKYGYQITQDEFASANPSLKVTAETKVSEIVEWFSKFNQGSFEVKLIELF